MNDRDKAAIAEIQEKWPVTATPGDNEICLEFSGIPEKFNLSTAHDEFTIFTDTWHEHFADMEQLVSFFDGLFTGKIQIVVKYRGKTPVAHQVQVLEDKRVNVMSRTGGLVSPFWRPKSYRTLRYATANKELKATDEPAP